MKRSPRGVSALVLLAIGALGYVLFHVLPFYSHPTLGIAGESRNVFFGWSIWGLVWEVITSFPDYLDGGDIEDWLSILILTDFPLGTILSLAAPFMLPILSGVPFVRWSVVVLSVWVIVFGPLAGWVMVSGVGEEVRWEISYYLWWIASLVTFTGLLVAPGKRSAVDS